MDLITVIVPCFNEEASLPYFFRAYEQLKSTMRMVSFELLFINDGSKDNTLSVIKDLAANHEEIKYISFSRNFGKEAAMYAGLQHAQGDYVVFMDADLQDPPSLLPDMYKAVAEDGYDSAATRRVTRAGEPPIRSFFARIFYRLMNRISHTELVDGARDYRLMSRKFVNVLLETSFVCSRWYCRFFHCTAYCFHRVRPSFLPAFLCRNPFRYREKTSGRRPHPGLGIHRLHHPSHGRYTASLYWHSGTIPGQNLSRSQETTGVHN